MNSFFLCESDGFEFFFVELRCDVEAREMKIKNVLGYHNLTLMTRRRFHVLILKSLNIKYK